MAAVQGLPRAAVQGLPRAAVQKPPQTVVKELVPRGGNLSRYVLLPSLSSPLSLSLSLSLAPSPLLSLPSRLWVTVGGLQDIKIQEGAGIACWLEHRTRDRMVESSNLGRSGGIIFFSRANFEC